METTSQNCLVPTCPAENLGRTPKSFGALDLFLIRESERLLEFSARTVRRLRQSRASHHKRSPPGREMDSSCVVVSRWAPVTMSPSLAMWLGWASPRPAAEEHCAPWPCPQECVALRDPAERRASAFSLAGCRSRGRSI